MGMRQTPVAVSKENVELVRAALAAWREVDCGNADLQELTTFFAPDGAWDLGTFSGWPDQREFRGLDEFLQFREAWAEPYDEWSYEVDEIHDAGGHRVVATFHQRGRLRGSDSWIEQRYAIVYTIEGGMIQHAQVYVSADEALEAARLS